MLLIIGIILLIIGFYGYDFTNTDNFGKIAEKVEQTRTQTNITGELENERNIKRKSPKNNYISVKNRMLQRVLKIVSPLLALIGMILVFVHIFL